MNVLEHAVYKLRNATIHRYPFPHFFVEEVFPWDFYEHLVANLPDDYKPLGFKSRSFTDTLPTFMEEFKGSYFANAILSMFGQDFYERFPHHARPALTTEWRFIRDVEDYSIGPHTDAARKVVSLLFYLPKNSLDFDVGTALYVPTDHKKRCPGGPHHPFEGFEEIWRAPFTPNCVLGFWKTDDSWHGVPPIHREIERNVLLFNIYEHKDEKLKPVG